MMKHVLLPSGREQHEVLRDVGILIRILLYCLQSSRSFFSLVENVSLYQTNPSRREQAKGIPIAGFLRAEFRSIKSIKVVGYHRKYANEGPRSSLTLPAIQVRHKEFGSFSCVFINLRVVK